VGNVSRCGLVLGLTEGAKQVVAILQSRQVCSRVARFFVLQTYQNGKNITIYYQIYQTAINYIYQMTEGYSKWS
jgi:hypothetical protein